jgi:hypothetical protein
MRYIPLIFLFLFSYTCLQAQNEDRTWVFGYKYSEQPLANGIYFDFNDSLQITFKSKPMSILQSSAMICDSIGQLSLFSNGCYIDNGNNEYIANSDGLNPGAVYNEFCIQDTGGYATGYNSDNTMVFLPDPGNKDQVYLFHIPTLWVFQPFDAYYNQLNYTKIDLKGNAGIGSVVEKNKMLISDTLHYDGLAAVRHGNGRDWWVIMGKQFSNVYYLVLLTPEGITIKTQAIGTPTWSQSGGEFVFSPDGTKLARFNAKDDLRIFDFDRCSGTLSNPMYIGIQGNGDNQIFSGLAFSGDGHFLYAAENYRLLQFDMWAANIPESKTIVAEKESLPACSLGGTIAYMELAPDGRIYSRPLNGQSCMHRMQFPERPGIACNFQQHYYQFPYSFKNLPHLPNFRLGPIDGSACDTLGMDNHPLADWRYDHTGTFGVDFTELASYAPQNWDWDFGDPLSGLDNHSSQRNPSHFFSQTGAFEVCLTVSNAFGSDTHCKNVWITTVPTIEPASSESISIYPNPSTGLLSWSGIIGPVTVRIFNQLGQLQLEQRCTEGSVNLTPLQDGVYQLQLLDAGQLKATRSVVLMKH